MNVVSAGYEVGQVAAPPASKLEAPTQISENGLEVLRRRYLRKGPDGKPMETVPEMFWRVASNVALPERAYEGEEAYLETAEEFYDLLNTLRFFPNSPTFTGAGTPLAQLAACFVLAIDDDMGKDSPEGIFNTLRNAALIQQTGGGNGFSFSRLRPKGNPVNSSAGVASGPVGFLKVYDAAFGEIAQGGSRRGANMGVLRVDHPDIEEFIACKAKEGQIANFNISVGVTDAFMEAVKDDTEYDLINPHTKKVTRSMRARDIFDKISHYAHRNGEPGVLFLDAANRSNPVPHLYELEATNPCHRGDNLVHTSLGVVPIRELVGRSFSVVTPTGEVVKATAFPTGAQRIYRVHLDNGMQIDLTANHNLIDAEGNKVMVKDLAPGEKLRLASHAIEPSSAKYHFTEEEGLLLGWNAGDGWITYHSNAKVQAMQVGFVFGQQDEAIATWVRTKVAEKIGERTPMLKQRPGRGVIELATTNKTFVNYFMGELGAANKRQGVPVTVLEGNRVFQIGYLRGLFSADGYVSVKGKGKKERRQLGLVSAHENLARDVQTLLSTFGIISRLRHSESHLPGRNKTYHRWQITINADQFVRFMHTIGFMPESGKKAVAEAMLEREWRDTRTATTAMIAAVEDLNAIEPVYNINIDHPSHQFCVNGLVSANCGEQFLGPYENCCLGSINLAQHVTDDGKIDWAKLEKTVVESTRFLDDVVSANKYVPAVPQLQDAAHRVRRIGLGIMGLADVMYRLGVRYGDQESLDLAGQVMEFVRYHCMRTSIDLARERGPFLAIEGSIYDPNNLKWQPPTPLQPYTHEFGRLAVDWDTIVEGIKAHGIRNGAQSTIAPTGTIGTVTGCEGYGCEPVFALAYTRYVKEAGGDVALTYVSPLFIEALDRAGIIGERRERIVDQIVHTGTCQGVHELPQPLRHTFVVSQDVTAEQHVLMQAALQCYVDNSISKTVNLPEGATSEDVKTVYMSGWELGCKGLTVYVTGSRQEVVLETKATADAKKAGMVEQVANGHASIEETLVAVPHHVDVAQPNGTSHHAGDAPEYQSYDIKRPRPKRLHGATYRRLTPLGTAYVTVNDTEEGEPFEVFMNVGKAGSDVAAVSEALGRLISLTLRMPSSLSPTERLQQVVYQLNGIGGGRHLGFGPQRVRSLPDAIAQVLAEHLEEVPAPAPHLEPPAEQLALPIPKQIGDLCPDCGNSTLLNIEGCRKCHVCGYSEC